MIRRLCTLYTAERFCIPNDQENSRQQRLAHLYFRAFRKIGVEEGKEGRRSTFFLYHYYTILPEGWHPVERGVGDGEVVGGGGEEEEEEDEGHDEADHHKKQRRLPVHLKLLQLILSIFSWTACPLLLPMNLIYVDSCLITAVPNSYSFKSETLSEMCIINVGKFLTQIMCTSSLSSLSTTRIAHKVLQLSTINADVLHTAGVKSIAVMQI